MYGASLLGSATVCFLLLQEIADPVRVKLNLV